jgi:hypothetical protein
MFSNKKLPFLIGAPIAVGLLTSPLWATTPKHEELGRSFVDTTQIELIYPQFAQVGGNSVDSSNNDNDQSNSNDNQQNQNIASGPSVEVSDAQTAVILRQIEDSERICEFMGDEYRISCFAQTYRDLAEEIPSNGDYAEAKTALMDASRKLDALARSNRDRSKPALRAKTKSSNGRTVTTRPITAVPLSRAPELNRQASAIVAEAETVLLRSASSDARRAIHYQRIAAAVGSNKVLLRSA